MSRKTVNTLMSILAIAYTIFIIVRLILAVCDAECSNRLIYIVSYGVGIVCGVLLIFIIRKERCKNGVCRSKESEQQ